MIEISHERPDDLDAIRYVNQRAFGGSAEAALVDLLRARHKLVSSLVARQDDQVVGHILFSPVTVATNPDSLRVAGLAPMSVLPEFQSRGVGSRLVRAGLAACQDAGYDVIVVLGHASYYPRFGFAPARNHGLMSEYEAPEAFMALELRKGSLARLNGLVEFAPEFREAGC